MTPPWRGDDDFAGNGYFVCQNGVRGMFRGMHTGGMELSYDITGTEGMIRLMDDSRSPELWRIEEGLPGQRGSAPACHFFRLSHKPRPAGVNVLYDLMNCIETGPGLPLYRRRRSRSSRNRYRRPRIASTGRWPRRPSA